MASSNGWGSSATGSIGLIGWIRWAGWIAAVHCFAVLFVIQAGCSGCLPPPEPPAPSPAVIGEKALDGESRKALLGGLAPAAAVSLQPPDGDTFRFIIDSVESIQRGTSYQGHVDGAPGSSGTVVVVGRSVAGTIRIPGRSIYVLATARGGETVIRAIDPARLPPDHPPGFGEQAPPASGGQGADNGADTCATDDPRRVTIMIVYTAAARAGAGGTEAIEATIYGAIAEANQSLVNSDINMQFDLVHLEEVDYTSGGDVTADICRLHDPGDGYLDDIQAKRNTYRADLVAMVANYSSFCGLTYGVLVNAANPCSDVNNHAVVGTPANAREEGAYHVFDLGCIQSNFTLPHEFGHSGSARHNWQCDNTDNAPTHANHGFYYDDGTSASWRTILTYPLSSGCGTHGSRVPYFSNPSINYLGHATGTSTGTQPADNHAVLNTSRAVLANYRCSAAAPSNVWMKDTWGDTGAEPDADPDIMYASPYVWTRRAQDPVMSGATDRYQHEHQHENPVLHQPTWAYVKLHNNGGAGAGGHVKLYYANASTSLAWPSGWTQIGDVEVLPAQFAAGATKVVEIPWADPPGTGHYCLTARWESPSDPIASETNDIGANTRNSNNIIWRNVTIVSLSGGDTGDASFVARSLAGGAFILEFTSPGRRPFLPDGDLTFALRTDERPIAGKPGEGIRETAPGEYKVTANGGRIFIDLSNSKSGFVTVNLKFQRTEKLEQREYRVLVNQLEVSNRDEKGQMRQVGGVAFDLLP